MREGIPIRGIQVIYDDLDLDVGRLRLRKSGSAGGGTGLSLRLRNLVFLELFLNRLPL